MIKPELLRPIRTIRCHCSNKTETLGTSREPTAKTRRPCCLMCRCDEHVRGEYRRTDTLPGCGPMCIYHKPSVITQRTRIAEDRAMDLNLH